MVKLGRKEEDTLKHKVLWVDEGSFGRWLRSRRRRSRFFSPFVQRTHLAVQHHVSDAAGETVVTPRRRRVLHSPQLKRLEHVQIPEEKEDALRWTKRRSIQGQRTQKQEGGGNK